MNYYPLSLRNLIKNISKLPGIGAKTAERLAMHILKAPEKEAEELSRSILDMKEKIRFCSICFALSDSDICLVCSDQSRKKDLLCVVEQPGDMVAIEKSGSFNGLYHILGGVLSPMDGIGPDKIRIKELMLKIGSQEIQEVVLATGTNVEGEATASYIAKLLEKYPLKIASGVPMGGDLKYVDLVTLKRAMDTRLGV